jgi:hypothetical protein
MKNRPFKSDRGFPLMFQGEPRPDGKSVLTMEDYLKWYDIYCVTPHGKVHRLPWEAKSGYYGGPSRWTQHCPTPEYCRWLVTNNPEYAWDDASLAEIEDRIHAYRED